MFCAKCGSILRPKEKANKKILYCSCGFSKSLDSDDISTELKETIIEKKKVEVVEHLEINPKIRIKCEKCGHNIAHYWTQQTRGADEPETRFFKCAKCNHTWREYA